MIDLILVKLCRGIVVLVVVALEIVLFRLVVPLLVPPALSGSKPQERSPNLPGSSDTF